MDLYLVNFVKLEKLDLYSSDGAQNPVDMNVLEKVNFKELKELTLCYISNINFLKKVKFDKLEKIILKAKHFDINIFEKLNFKELKELYLFSLHMDYMELKVLEKLKFEKLEKMTFIINNEYSEINMNGLEKANFKELKELKFADIN